MMESEERDFIRKSVFSMVSYEAVGSADGRNLVRLLDCPAFIKNKLAQVLVPLI